MQTRLEAERSLQHVTDTAAAFGSMPEGEQQRYMSQLKRDAIGTAMSVKQRREQRAAGAAAAIASLGIAVETVEGGGGISENNSEQQNFS